MLRKSVQWKPSVCRGDVVVHLKPSEKLEVYGPIILPTPIIRRGVVSIVVTLDGDLTKLREKFDNEKERLIVFIGDGEKTGVYRTVLDIDAENNRVTLASADPDSDQDLIQNSEYRLYLTNTSKARKGYGLSQLLLSSADEALRIGLEPFKAKGTVLISAGPSEYSNIYWQLDILPGASGFVALLEEDYKYEYPLITLNGFYDSYRMGTHDYVWFIRTPSSDRWKIIDLNQSHNIFSGPKVEEINIPLISTLPTSDYPSSVGFVGPFCEKLTQTEISTLLLEEIPTGLQEEFEKAKNDKRDLVLFIGKGNVGTYRKLIRLDGKKLTLSSTIADEIPGIQLDYVGISNIIPFETLIKRELGVPTKITVSENTFLGGVGWLDGATAMIESYENGSVTLKEIQLEPVPQAGEPDPDNPQIVFKPTHDDGKFGGRYILVPPTPYQKRWKIDPYINHRETKWQTSTIRRIADGDLCVAAYGSDLIAARVDYITEEKETGQFDLKVDSWQPAALSEKKAIFPRSQTTVFGKFKEEALLKDGNFNEEPINKVYELTLDDEEAAGKLKNRLIVIEQEAPQARQSHGTSVKNVQRNTITLREPLPTKYEYITGSTVIRANVVSAGHGEVQSERILGSGNATLSNQEFLFPVSDVSFIFDSTQSSGVRADIDVIVDGEPWIQVSRFNRSLATDPHYAVRMTEDGHLRIVFGDGVNGRRLPTGENNVRIAWRRGSGDEGNLPAGSFKKPAHPHPRVEAIDQPFPSVGGKNTEPVTSLRRSAPASLSTMERAVAASDFADLAAAQPTIWYARAEQKSKSSNRERDICVIVVPVQGVELSDDSKSELKATLLSHAVPGVRIEVENHESEPLKLHITLGIDNERFDVDAVKAEIRKTLLQRFKLENRAIGTPVYLSDIYQCVEAARGVEYSTCKFKVRNIRGEYDISDDPTLYPTNKRAGVLNLSEDDSGCIDFEEDEAQK